MAKAGGTIRAAAQIIIRAAAKEGLTAAETIRRLTDRGLTYRRTNMLADWRSHSNVTKKEGLLRFVRKDRLPTAEIARVEGWDMSREFMYKVRVQQRLRPGEPITERFINIMSDRPLTPGEIESQVQRDWGKMYPQQREPLEGVIAETAIQRGEV